MSFSIFITALITFQSNTIAWWVGCLHHLWQTAAAIHMYESAPPPVYRHA